MKRHLKIFVIKLLLFVGILSILATNWFIAIFDDLSLDEIIFHLKVPMTGSNTDFLISFMRDPLLKALGLCLIIILLYYSIMKLFKFLKIKIRFNKIAVHISLTLLLIFSFNYTFKSLGFKEYLKNNLDNSTLYDEFYVKANSDLITFPQKKRNLIYIFLESYESTFTSKQFGGDLQENTLYKMVELAQSQTHFSNTNKLGGAAPASGTGWTVGGMVAQTSGIHLKLPINGNSYGEFEYFLPGVISMGDLLEKENYNQTLFIGSDADFGGRSNYFTQHGNYEIKDYNYAIEAELIPQDYLQWWGYEDEKLFEFAKDELMSLASKDEPFNFTMLTADTHHVDGYVTKGMETPFDEQYKNVLLNSSRQVFEFITWIQQQDFYENTTIVVSGDHLTMDAGFIERNVSSDYNRRIYNVIINSVISANNSENREFAMFDLFPTTLASMGVEIEGERLGIGTNLFSNEETLFEKLGSDFVNSELSKRSKFYSDNIISLSK